MMRSVVFYFEVAGIGRFNNFFLRCLVQSVYKIFKCHFISSVFVFVVAKMQKFVRWLLLSCHSYKYYLPLARSDKNCMCPSKSDEASSVSEYKFDNLSSISLRFCINVCSSFAPNDFTLSSNLLRFAQ